MSSRRLGMPELTRFPINLQSYVNEGLSSTTTHVSFSRQHSKSLVFGLPQGRIRDAVRPGLLQIEEEGRASQGL